MHPDMSALSGNNDCICITNTLRTAITALPLIEPKTYTSCIIFLDHTFNNDDNNDILVLMAFFLWLQKCSRVSLVCGLCLKYEKLLNLSLEIRFSLSLVEKP